MPRQVINAGKHHTPWQRCWCAVTAARVETAEPPDPHGRCDWHCEAVARLDPHAKQPFRDLDAEISADKSTQNGFTIRKPRRAAQEAFPVGKHKRQLGADHRPAERAEANEKLLTRRKRQC